MTQGKTQKNNTSPAAFIRLMRVHQWVKNTFILLPMFFAVKMDDPDILLRTLAVAVCFSLVASAIYIFNDWIDVEDDRKHPVKSRRPLASGEVSLPQGLGLMVVLLAVGLTGVFLIQAESFYVTAGYVIMNLMYSIRLKHVPILDITLIALGFVLRLYAGSFAGGDAVKLSMWMTLIAYLLALFLALAKRRDDVLLAMEGNKVRKAIDGYNLEFINGAMMIMASVTIVAYISYTISEEVTARFHSHYLYITVFWVILGILRYMQITFVEAKSGSPTRVLLRDLFLQFTILAWITTFVLLIYLPKWNVPILQDK